MEATQSDTQKDKRQVTRQALLDAAAKLVAERGHDRISVQEITDRANVATGTYYNYFGSKQEVFTAVAEQMQERLAGQLAELREPIHDHAMIVAMTLKFYFRHSLDNQDWLDFTRSIGLVDLALTQPAEQLREDIERGMKAGRFRIDDVSFTQDLITGMVSHATHQIQRGQLGRNGIELTVRAILQMLGLPELVSKALTQTPLPAKAAPRRDRATMNVLETLTPGDNVTSFESHQRDPI